MKNDWVKYRAQIEQKINWKDIYDSIKNQKESGEGWISGLCPFHNDKNNSFSFHKINLNWVCFAGCGKGSVFDFIMHTSGKSFKETLIEWGDRLNVIYPDFRLKGSRPIINNSTIDEWVTFLYKNDQRKNYLKEKRGLNDRTISENKIGWDPKRERFTIPIRDENGNCVNVRLYNSEKEPKIINYTTKTAKYGSPARLYGLDKLIGSNSQQVIICEGEWDRLLLEQNGFTSVTSTHGCNTFRLEWIKYFKNKDVVIIYDCDKEGQRAVTEIILKAFKDSEIRSIKNIVLPLQGIKEDKDITDYFHKHGYNSTDLRYLIDNTSTYNYFSKEKTSDDIISLDSFVEIGKQEYIDKRVKCEITISGETSEEFYAVEEFQVTYCCKQSKGDCMNCRGKIKVPVGSQEYIGSCMSTNVQLISMLRSFCCNYDQKPSIEILKRTPIKEFFCHQKTNRITQSQDPDGEIIQIIDGKKQELVERKVYYLSSDNIKPGSYSATGWIKPHPKTQQITFLIELLNPLEEDYQSFKLQDNINYLKEFQKIGLQEIVSDLSNNVTRIYEREDLLISILLTYCSPLWIKFNNDLIRGWMVICIIGDSGSGKTQTFSRLSEFINIGDIFSGLTGSRTGLAYALYEHPQKGWNVSIGRYPANSRKILIVDEAQYLHEKDLRIISKAMDEGFMQIDRVKSQGYESMTRLIMVANPKEDKIMDSCLLGCETLKGIFPPTIIRRIDLAVFINSNDISNINIINKKFDNYSERKITPEMLRAVIFWAWNLKAGQIYFTQKAIDICLDLATSLGNKFGYAIEIPLVLRENFRNTLARISTAFAVLDMSADDSFTKLIVDTQHIFSANEYICRVYTAKNCGLDEYSEIQRLQNQLDDYETIEREFLKKKEFSKYSVNKESNFVKALHLIRINKFIRREDLAEQVECSIEVIKPIVQLLKKYNLIDSTKDGYFKKPKFNRFLHQFLEKHVDFFKNEISGGGVLSDLL